MRENVQRYGEKSTASFDAATGELLEGLATYLS
jgi:hypothetical protein